MLTDCSLKRCKIIISPKYLIMADKIKLNIGNTKLTLKKSSKLVGVKTKASSNIEETKGVKKKILKNLGGFEIVELKRKGASCDKKLDAIRKKEDVKIGTHVYYAEGSVRPLLPTGEIIIEFADNTNLEEQNIVFDEYALEIVERRGDCCVIAKVTADSPNPLKVAKYLQDISMVKNAEPDLDTLLDEYDGEFTAPHDELVNHQWHLKNPGFVVDAQWPMKKGADARVWEAWQKMGNMGSDKITVAVIDNGFDLTHPDIMGKVHKPFDLWTNTSNIEQGDPRFTHGTPCASVAVARPNGTGIVGAAPNSKFMPISGTSYSLRATEKMFKYAMDNGADVISCSWGTTDPAFELSEMKKAAIADAARNGRNGKGCVIVYAVGNDDFDYVSYYAQHPDVIAVGACTSKDEHATYSNKGPEVTICAPSNGDWPITAARAFWDEGVSWESGAYRFWRDGRDRGDRYKHFGGTSSSCPLVAGICALMLSENPDLTSKQVKEILCKTADKIGSPQEYDANGHSKKFGYGRVNALAAVREAISRRGGSGSSDSQDTSTTTGPTTTTPPVVTNPTSGSTTTGSGSTSTSSGSTSTSISSGRGIFRFSVQRQEPTGFGVQMGAFREYGNVLIYAERMQKLFGEPIIVSINQLAGETVYKIVVGVFNSREEARSLKQIMANHGVTGFIRNIKDLK